MDYDGVLAIMDYDGVLAIMDYDSGEPGAGPGSHPASFGRRAPRRRCSDLF